MKFKDVVLSEASTEAKVAALALLLDKELIRLAETVLNVQKLQGPQGEQGLQGPKGEQGERGLDGAQGLNGKDGVDGKDGIDGKDGVGVADARIDFDGTLVITLTNGKEITAGDVVPTALADSITLVKNGGGTSDSILNTLTSLQNQIDALTGIDGELGTMAQQNDTAVDINGGSIDGTAIGSTTPAAGTFTTLTATGTSYFGGSSISRNVQVDPVAAATSQYTQFSRNVAINEQQIIAASTANLGLVSTGGGTINFWTATSGEKQFVVGRTASAVNYVQVTGAATTGNPTFTATGSDANVGLDFRRKGGGSFNFYGDTYAGVNGNNSWLFQGAATGLSPRIVANGSDTNISQVFQSKGTGAIDLAAGSRGVNISNGGTVTAITRTATGTSYTSIPSVAITAPTTAGGVQAVGNVALEPGSFTIVSGGSGYAVNDVVEFTSGTFYTQKTRLTVTTVSAGAITGVSIAQYGRYTVMPNAPDSVTTITGTGTGATISVATSTVFAVVITNAGSGYVEQPTVTFSGGGGSGAAAYATVGSGSIIRSLGSTGTQSLSFYTPSGEVLRLRDTGSTGTYVMVNTTASGANVLAQGATNAFFGFNSNGTGSIDFGTNGNTGNTQLRVAHTASAVNYVQVTGGATGNNTTISTQGSDGSIGLTVLTRGTSATGSLVSFASNLTQTNYTFRIAAGSTANANYLQVAPAATTASPVLSAQGSDTNIDLTLTPKGTGNVRFGTLTASADAPITGYITIKDSGGTVRKLAVIA